MSLSEVAIELRQLEERDGELNPYSVLEWAEDPNTACHQHFDWNDKTAAANWRLQQARQLIRSVKIEFQVNKVEVKVPRYTKDPNKSNNEAGYKNVKNLIDDKEQSRAVLANEMKRVQGAASRAKAYAAVLGQQEDVQAIEDKAQEVLDSIKVNA